MIEADSFDFHLYIDESGNAGSNLIDPQQPVFVHAGILVPEDGRVALETHVESLRKKFLPYAAELHSGILNTGKGREAAGLLLKTIHQYGGHVYSVIAERRIVIAHYVIDVCLDAEWNDCIDDSLLGAATARQEIAERLVVALPEKELREFAKEFRARDAVRLRSVVDRMSRMLDLAGDWSLGHAIAGSIPQLAEQLATIQSVDQQASGIETVNYSYLSLLLSHAEIGARANRLGRGEVVHDQSPQGPSYHRLFESRRQGYPGHIVYDNNHVLVGRFESLSALREADSRDEPILQLADVVARVFVRLTQSRKHGRNREDDLDIWVQYAMASLAATPPFVSVHGSLRFLDSLFGPTLRALAERVRSRTPESG